MTITQKDLAVAEREIVEEHQLKEKVVNEEFKIWKKTVPLLYDTIHTYVLDYPSLAIKWLPDYTYSDNKNSVNVKFLIGTNTSHNSSNYLKLGSVNIPSTLAPDFSTVNPDVDSITVPSSVIEDTSDFRILSKWKQTSEINKLDISPNGKKVLSFNSDGVVHSYDLENNDVIDYKYHKSEGYALTWFGNDSFISGSNDSQIALWSLDKPSTPIQLFKSHNGAVNDISYNPNFVSIFGSVSDDSSTQFHDSRASGDNPVIKQENQHIQMAISVHPEIETLYATGGKDNVVSLYDIRNYKIPLRKFFGHNDSVAGIKWDVEDPRTLISWSLDKRIITWDLKDLEEEYAYPDGNENSRRRAAVKIDPCLRFIHGGHTNRVNDFDVHPKIRSLYASVGDDNLLEVWKPKTLSYEEEEGGEEAEDPQDSEQAIEQEVPGNKEELASQDTNSVSAKAEETEDVASAENNEEKVKPADDGVNDVEMQE
ncbi:hypothetical protein G9P44_000383 [Scheffersomyces stipitis]|nr:hypothetical protein G9P44_000383 [Scheffersomyces stipitis]